MYYHALNHMYIFKINYNDSEYYVPIVFRLDNSTGLSCTLLPTMPKSKLHLFGTQQEALCEVQSRGLESNLESLLAINVDKISQWANNPAPTPVSLTDLENFEGLMGSVFCEIDEPSPEHINYSVIAPLMNEVFYEPKLKSLKYPNEHVVSEKVLQFKINNSISKKYYQTLIQHFERVMFKAEGDG